MYITVRGQNSAPLFLKSLQKGMVSMQLQNNKMFCLAHRESTYTHEVLISVILL